VAVGLPGYPIAAAMVAREILVPLVSRLLGEPRPSPAVGWAIAAESIGVRSGLEELVRVDVVRVGDRTVVHPLARGAGALASLSRAGGIVRLHPGSDGPARGDSVAVEAVAEVERSRTILFAGLADPLIDALEDFLRARGAAVRIALRPCPDESAEALLASGLVHGRVVARPGRDRVSGDPSNPAGTSPPGARLAVALGRRPGGLVVARGNPLGLRAPADVSRAGARTLPTLKRGGTPARARAIGEVSQATTASRDGASASAEIPPLAAAALVASGVADVAFATGHEAALAGADFVPVLEEEVVLELAADGLGTVLVGEIESFARAGDSCATAGPPPRAG